MQLRRRASRTGGMTLGLERWHDRVGSSGPLWTRDIVTQDEPRVACVVLAHNDPLQVGRLTRALKPFLVVLHCDRGAPRHVVDAMKTGMEPSTVFISEEHTAWVTWGLVSAELRGIDIALRYPSIEHIVVLSGADYPIVPAEVIAAELAARRDQSILHYFTLPQSKWGPSGGISRFEYWHKPMKRHMVRIPIRRRHPDGVVPAGGGAQRVLCRRHAEEVLRVRDTRRHHQILAPCLDSGRDLCTVGAHKPRAGHAPGR